MVATADAFRNNCSLHCFAHVWLHFLHHANPEQLEQITKLHPAYQDVLGQVNAYYGLELKDWEQLLALDAQFPHPYDREIFWGPVLRNTLQQRLPAHLKDEVAGAKPILEDHFAQLANDLGASIQLYARFEENGNTEVVPVRDYQAQNEFFQLPIYYTQRGGGHYDFSYGSEQLDEQHNAAYKKNVYNQRLPIGQCLLKEIFDTVGVREQDELIRQCVNELIPRIQAKHTLENTFTQNKYHNDLQRTCEAFNLPMPLQVKLNMHLANLLHDIANIEDLDEKESEALLDDQCTTFNQELRQAIESIDSNLAKMISQEQFPEGLIDEMRNDELTRLVNTMTGGDDVPRQSPKPRR